MSRPFYGNVCCSITWYNNSYTRFWTGEVTGVRRMRAHIGSQWSETGEIQTHIRVY
jgi:hypothetical protein